MIAAIALHWRAALVALVAAALCALGWHFGAAHVTAQWSAEKVATAQATSKALAAALANQQAAESKVAAIETQFNSEVSQHAKDALDYRARLASGTERVSVRVTRCSPASEGAGPASGSDGGAAVADLDPAVASGLAEVAADDQGEIDKLRALQSYVRAMQAQGFIEP
jgi:prophage endopeptidase